MQWYAIHNAIPEEIPDINIPSGKRVANYVKTYVERLMPQFQKFILDHVKDAGACVTIDMSTKKVHWVVSTVHIVTENL